MVKIDSHAKYNRIILLFENTEINPDSEIKKIELNFHLLIKQVLHEYNIKDSIDLPLFNIENVSLDYVSSLMVDEMYGGFIYWFEIKDEQLVLISKSYCRVSDSKEIHLINSDKYILIESE